MPRRHYAPIAVMLGLLVAPAWAQPIAMTITNGSTLTILALNTFPVDPDGVPIEDNLGGLDAELSPGATASFAISGEKCGPLYVQLEVPGDRQVTAIIDTCKTRALHFND